MRKYRITSAFASVLLSIFMICFSMILIFHSTFLQRALYEKEYQKGTVATINGQKISVNEATFNYEVFVSCFFPTGDHHFELPTITTISDKNVLPTMYFFYNLIFYGGIFCLLAFLLCLLLLHKRHRYRCFIFAPLISISLTGLTCLTVGLLPIASFDKVRKIIFSNHYEYLPFTKDFLAILPNNLLLYQCVCIFSFILLLCGIFLFIHHRCYRKKAYKF